MSAARAPAALGAVLLTALAALGCGGDQDLEPGDAEPGAWTADDSLVFDAPTDRWTLTLDSGVRVRIDLAAADSGTVELALLGITGQEVGWATAIGTATIIYRAARGGRHQVLAVSPRGQPRDRPYRLAVTEEAGGVAPPGAAVPIAVGQTIQGILEIDDEGGDMNRYGRFGRFRSDRFAFRADSGSVVTITARSADFDAVLAVSHRYFTAAIDDDGAGGTDASITVVVPTGDSVDFAVTTLGRRPTMGRYVVTLGTGGDSAVPLDGDPISHEYPDVPLPANRVCEGKPVRRALPYDSTRAGKHVTAVVEVGRPGMLDTFDRPEDADLELVLCLTHEEEVLERCYYLGPSGGPPIDRYRHRWRGRLLEARTARLVTELRIEGDEPRRCQAREQLMLTRLDGSLSDATGAARELATQMERYTGIP